MQYQPWFALDAATESSSASSPATIRIKVTGKDDQRKITVRCDDGIAWVGLMDADPVFAFKEFGKNFAEKSSVASKPLSERASQSDLPTVVEISSEELKQMTGKRRLRQIRTISGSGRTADKLL